MRLKVNDVSYTISEFPRETDQSILNQDDTLAHMIQEEQLDAEPKEERDN